MVNLSAGGICMANKNKKVYPYIWAVPINTQFELENNVSAYIEVNDDFFYDKFEKKKVVKVNPYVRFNKIFRRRKNAADESREDKNEHILKNFKRNIENNAISYLRELDFASGTTVIDIVCEKISEDIRKGILGKYLKKYFLLLNREEQEYVALLIYNEKINNVNSMKNFKFGIKYFFLDSIIYREKHQKNKIIIYINKEKNKENIAKIKILELLFLEFGLELKIFWKNHFGVVSVGETVKIDEIAVF